MPPAAKAGFRTLLGADPRPGSSKPLSVGAVADNGGSLPTLLLLLLLLPLVAVEGAAVAAAALLAAVAEGAADAMAK